MQYSTPLQNLLTHTANHPNKIFLHQPVNKRWQEFTWQEVNSQARCIAAALKAQGYQQGSHIGILSKNCAQWVIADLAIMMAGMISVPIYPTANRRTISYVIKHANLKAIFVGKLDELTEAEAAIDETLLSIAFPYPTLSAQTTFESWLSEYSPLTDIHQAGLDDIATIVYTSGSTGVPKGVVLTHKNWAAAAKCTVEKFKISGDDRILSYLPLAHIVERSGEAIALYSGEAMFFVESLDTFVENLQYAKPSLFISVPRLWTIFQTNILSKLSQKKLNFLLPIPLIGNVIAKKIRTSLGVQCARAFGSGTAPIPSSLLDWYAKIGMPISEGWGMTETAGLSCVNMPFSNNNLGTIGHPVDCVEMKISPVGEILIRGDAVFSGYYLNSEATDESFIDGWFRTGDCAEITQDGVYKITGRIKDKFKTSKGKYVTPVPIESALSANTDIGQVCLIGSGLTQPVALVVLNETIKRKESGVENNLAQTLQEVNATLESHEKLEHIVICKEAWSVENDLVTPTMKIKRNLIENKYNELVGKNLNGNVIWEEDIY
ncbi:MAG: AMP-binding protein [Litorilituus sp.]|jgi:long-subunit acyl-CoA synthetase (AMP-forming)|nr:AMP-binding protein [Litorilituus sp.]